MNAKSIIVDYGLPGLAAIGVGLLTFMLTGGPDEYPELPNHNEVRRLTIDLY